MDDEFQDIEAALKGLRPTAADTACMDRLLAAVERRVPVADAGIERELSRLSPVALSSEVSDRFLGVVSGVPFPGTEKVVLFPGKSQPAAAKVRERRPWIAAAAAVAVLGGFSALMLDGPQRSATGPVAGGKRTEVVAAARATPPGFVPASIGSGVQRASDEGLVWSRDGKPLRRVKVIYTDKVRYLDQEGRVIEVERPRVEELLLPEKMD